MIDGYASDSRNPYGRVSQEIAIERRLEREARTVNLGTLTHPRIPALSAQGVRVEVTYQQAGEPEHCGYFVVYVPVGYDPYETSSELVEAEAERRWPDAEYFSIDDTYSH